MSGKEWEEKDKENERKREKMKEGEKRKRKSEDKSQTSSQTDQTDLYCSHQSRFFPPLCVTCLPHLVTLSLTFPSFCMTFSHTNSFPSLHFCLSLSLSLCLSLDRWDQLLRFVSSSVWLSLDTFTLTLERISWFRSVSFLLFLSLPLQVFLLALFPSFTTWGGNRTPVTGDQEEVPLSLHLCEEREARNRKRNNSRMCHGKRGSEKVAQGMNEKR